MKIHEYQAKEVLARAGVPVPRGRIATTAEEAAAIAKELGGSRWVVKAQIHAGGRGKGGGVKLCSSIDEVEREAKRILGNRLVTPQTGPAGQTVRIVLVTEASEIAREYYAGVVLDRKAQVPVLMVSAEGGVDIEEVAARTPEKILRRPIDPIAGLEPYEGRILARGLGFTGAAVQRCANVLCGLVAAFLDTDASLAEINPLVLTPADEVIALDAKFSFDDNALYRHRDLEAYRDTAEEDPAELRAASHGLSYIKLDGTIGCMVNGAGLAMATLDIINHHGGEPANFLDVGGGATEEAVTEGFRIILSDAAVKGVLVNIFGGIMRCDVIAQAIVNAAKQVGFKVPLVVRLEGTNVDQGRRILEQARTDIPTMQAGTDLADAAKKVCAAVGVLN
ncbi:MAG TPA: ADP-forming succinate--CoA ligase subunit beta [Planctomycetota bacterium]|nr:ADP-forming succinate--CoA ligase subunit beta [Planctomycetota bacterium]